MFVNKTTVNKNSKYIWCFSAMFTRIPLVPLRVHRPTSRFSSFRRSASRDSTAELQDAVVVTDDGSTVVCWHPERPVPYELSQSLPEEPRDQVGSSSTLSVQCVDDVRELFKSRPPEVVREQLMKITHTTKHIWVPKGRAQYRKRIDPDREYL